MTSRPRPAAAEPCLASRRPNSIKPSKLTLKFLPPLPATPRISSPSTSSRGNIAISVTQPAAELRFPRQNWLPAEAAQWRQPVQAILGGTSAASMNGGETTARVVFEYGKNNEGYWTGQHLYQQVVERLLPVFEVTYGLGRNGLPCQGLFIFDNAAGHKIFAYDVLFARNLNLSDGGAITPKLRNASFTEKDGTVVQQLMQLAGGKQKGVRRTLAERMKWPVDGKCPQGKPFRFKCDKCKGAIADHTIRETRTGCCAIRQLQCEPYFVAQNSLLAEVIEEAGHLTLFLPKFHPELNRTFLKLCCGKPVTPFTRTDMNPRYPICFPATRM